MVVDDFWSWASMAIRVALNHVSHYRFDRAVGMSPHVVRLRPAPHARTPIHAYSLKVSPKERFLNQQQDPYGNYLARLVFPEKARELRIEVDLVAEMTVINPFDFFVEPGAATYPFVYETVLKRELAPYLETKPHGPLLSKLLKEVRKEGAVTIDYLVEINQAVHRAISYNIRMEPGVQTPEETLGGGVRELPGFCVAAGEFVEAFGVGGAVCVGLLDTAGGGCEVAGRAERGGAGFHGFACVGGGVSAGGGVGGDGCDERVVHGGGAHTAGMHGGADLGGADHGGDGQVRGGV
jgi:hypothetical protein